MAVVCPITGRKTCPIDVHQESMENAFRAGFRAAAALAVEKGMLLSPENARCVRDDGDPPSPYEKISELWDDPICDAEKHMERALEAEDIWKNDPRYEEGVQKELKRTTSRGRPSGSGGSGDPSKGLTEEEMKELPNKPYNPECCAARRWLKFKGRGAAVHNISEDGCQAGGQCTNEPESDSENNFCERCEKRYQDALAGEKEWHGSFAKSIQDDPGWEGKSKGGRDVPKKWAGLKTEDSGEGTGLEKTSSKKAEKKTEKKTEKKKKVEKKTEKKTEKLEKTSSKKAEKKLSKKATKKEESEEPVVEPKANEEVPAVEEKKDEVVEDQGDYIEIDGVRFIHDEETDTLYNTEGEPVGNLVDGKPVLDIDNQTEDMSDEEDEDEEVSDDSEDEE